MAKATPKPGGPGQTIYFRTCLHNTIHRVLSNRPGWVETDSDEDFDFVWADKNWMQEHFEEVRPSLQDHQRVNHFKNHFELTRKDLMVKNLKRIKKQLDKEDRKAESAKYDFFPPTFVLPSEYMMFENSFNSAPGMTWIAKPTGRAQGKGIYLVTDLRDMREWKKWMKWKEDSAKPKAPQRPEPVIEPYIVQRYVDNPYLVGGKKFDLRIYVAVTSFSPLTVWLYRSGFARFSGSRYTSDTKDLTVHATNVAIQKHASNYDPDQGCKWSLHSLKMYLTTKHGYEKTQTVFFEIQMAILRSLLAVQKTIMQDKHCFELYGYDVLLDEALKPWLIEVNASPSLTADTVTDERLKMGMLEDLMDILDLEGRRVGDEQQIGGFDLIYLNGPIQVDKQGNHVCYLGCHNPREKVRRKMLRRIAAQSQQQPRPSAASR